MTIAASTPPSTLTDSNRLRERVRGRPVSAFAILAFGLEVRVPAVLCCGKARARESDRLSAAPDVTVS